MTYQLSRNGVLYGPYTIEDIRRYLASGNILASDLAKSVEMTDWISVTQLLAGGITPPPPVPASFEQTYRGPFADATPIPGEYLFFPVSPVKFCIMSVCTFGLYHVYWSYKNWKLYQQHVDSSASPVLRAIFAGIWNFPLFIRVKERAAEEEMPVNWPPILLGILVILLGGILSRLPGGWGLISLLSFLPYLPVVLTIQRINRKHAPGSGANLNERFSGWNIAGVVFGGLLLALALIGTALPKPKPAPEPQTTTVDVGPPS